MRVALVLTLVACGTQTSDSAHAATGDACGSGDLDVICDDTRIDVTAGPNPQDGPILDANTTYSVAGFAPGKRSYVVFEPQTSGEYSFYLGGPPVSSRFCDEYATCSGAAPKGSCMRTAATYELLAGERYEIELGAIPPGQRVLLHLKAPADEDRIVFSGMLDGQASPDLYAVRADGSGLIRLTSTPDAEILPRWSPDRSRVAFLRNNRMFTIASDGTGEFLVAAMVGRPGTTRGTTAPGWSPDGLQLAYPYPRPPLIIGEEMIDESYATSLHVINVNGTNDRLLYDDFGTDANPFWAPDGSRIAFSIADDCPDCAGGSLYATIRPDGTDYQEIQPTSTFDQTHPVHGLEWSPDMTTYVYTANANYTIPESFGTIITRPVAVHTPRVLATNAWSPHWSRDGGRVAYIAADGIYTAKANGGNKKRVLAATAVRGIDF